MKVVTYGHEVGFDFNPHKVEVHGEFRRRRDAEACLARLRRDGYPARIVGRAPVGRVVPAVTLAQVLNLGGRPAPRPTVMIGGRSWMQ